VRAFCAEKETRHFLDPKPAFEDAPRDVFADHVHFNQKGYDIYAAFFREALKEEVAKF
jgi:lysophospholipase L1-like esterase